MAGFGYRCQECGSGTVLSKVLPQYQTKVDGRPLVVGNAIVGVCDQCGAEHFDPKETKRWRTLLKPEHSKASAEDANAHAQTRGDDHGVAAWENEGGQ